MDIKDAIEILEWKVRFYSCGPSDCPCRYEEICNNKENDYLLYKACQIVLKEIKKS